VYTVGIQAHSHKSKIAIKIISDAWCPKYSKQTFTSLPLTKKIAIKTLINNI